MILVIMAKSSKLLLFMPLSCLMMTSNHPRKSSMFSPSSILHLSKTFLEFVNVFHHFSCFLSCINMSFFRKLQKFHNSLGSSIITYQQLVTIFQMCNYFSCHWLPFLFMHYKLPTSQNFNKINVKIVKQYVRVKFMGRKNGMKIK